MRSALLALALVGCKGKDTDRTPAATTPSVRFEAADDFWSAPLPSDHRISAGVIDLSGFPNPDGTEIVDQTLGLMREETGWGITSGVILPTDAEIDPSSLPATVAETMDPDASVFLVAVESDIRVPAKVTVRPQLDHDARHSLAVVPYQGVPLRPNTVYAVAVTTAVKTVDGDPLVPSLALRSLSQGRPLDVFGEGAASYQMAFDAIDEDLAGLAVFTTGDPAATMDALVDDIRTHPMSLVTAPALVEVFDDFCVYEGELEVTSYQTGTAPFTTGGGGIAWVSGEPQPDHTERGRFWLTVPRNQPGARWPVAVMVRTGGGGDRPMIDRGQRDADGNALEPGEGPARYFARAGWAGFQYDGPLGGLRNPTGGDEQFLVFNVTNPEALRDNLRQSAAELALIPGFVEGLPALDASGCPDTAAAPTFDTSSMALMGHSMGATIAPLVLPNAFEYRHVILSGAGGSWIENIVHKESPLEVRPLAEAMLGYSEGQLTGDDPFLQLLQWAGEAADPPVHGARSRVSGRNFLVFQGIVDTYILPPIANTTNLAFGLDLAGDALDETDPRLDVYDTLSEVQWMVGTGQVSLPVTGNQLDTAVVVQHIEDGVEDGHEVMFQLDASKAQYQEFLRTARAWTPTVP